MRKEQPQISKSAQDWSQKGHSLSTAWKYFAFHEDIINTAFCLLAKLTAAQLDRLLVDTLYLALQLKINSSIPQMQCEFLPVSSSPNT